MGVHVEAHRDAMLPDIPPETVHGRDGSFIFVESAIDLSGGVIDVAHEHTGWPSAFKPVVVGAIHLYHLPIAIFPGTPPRLVYYSLWTFFLYSPNDPSCLPDAVIDLNIPIKTEAQSSRLSYPGIVQQDKIAMKEKLTNTLSL